jgi:hypothetical protein
MTVKTFFVLHCGTFLMTVKTFFVLHCGTLSHRLLPTTLYRHRLLSTTFFLILDLLEPESRESRLESSLLCRAGMCIWVVFSGDQ